jgi:hypothetical protein
LRFGQVTAAETGQAQKPVVVDFEIHYQLERRLFATF